MGIGAPLNAIKTEAEGGWTMMSAPMPSTRLADSRKEAAGETDDDDDKRHLDGHGNHSD